MGNRVKGLHLNIRIVFLIGFWFLSACSQLAPEGFVSTTPTETRSLPSPLVYTAGPDRATLSPTAEATLSTETVRENETPPGDLLLQPTVPATVTVTPDPYAAYTIDYLAGRAYGGGGVEAVEILAVNSYFTRTLFAYPSDGLTIYGFMNVPRGAGPFPVVIANHGYIDPAIYNTLDYTTGDADALARAGFFVLHPNLRGYPPSDSGDNLFRVGMAIDVLNLVALVKELGGQPGPLERANPEAIGLWGHSMGGGVATRVLTVSPDVDAAVLYAAMSGDERQNFEAINRWSDGERGLDELAVPETELARISPIFFYDRIQVPVSVHHSLNDELVPVAWSLDFCARLSALEKPVECYTYEGQPHTFRGEGSELFQQRVIEFFNRTLRGES